jgi:hypothetical protein
MFLIKNHVTMIQCIYVFNKKLSWVQHYGGWQNIGCIIHKYMWKQNKKVICHLVKECIFYKQQGEQLTTYAWNHFPYVFSLSSVMLLQWMNYSYPQFYYLIQDYIDSVIFVWTKGMLMLDIISDRSTTECSEQIISFQTDHQYLTTYLIFRMMHILALVFICPLINGHNYVCIII